MDAAALSKTLRDLRVRRGLTLAELAARVNTSVATLSRYEHGWERFELYTLKKIAMALGCTVDLQFKPIEPAKAPKTARVVIKRLKRLFWDHPLKEGDLRRHPVWIAERVIEYGSLEDVQSLIHLVGKNRFLKLAARCRFQSPRTERFWRTILAREGVPCLKRSFPREAKNY